MNPQSLDEIIHKFTDRRENTMGKYLSQCKLFWDSKAFGFPQVIYKLSEDQSKTKTASSLSIKEVTKSPL